MSNRPVNSHPFVIEGGRPLSRSMLWDLQRQLYVRQGVQAWREAGVPHYVTDNSFVARSYARVTLAHLRSAFAGAPDARQRGATILELGAGTGRFAFHFLTHFLAMWGDSELAGVPVTYVMTDIAGSNVEFWRSHPALAPFVERGQLVFATCDAEDPAEPERVLEASVPGKRGCPLVVFANYFFDALRQDFFYCDGGRLSEGLVALRSSRPELDPRNPLATLAIEVGRRPMDGALSDDPSWRRLLEGYVSLGRSGAVLFPASAMRCLDRLRSLPAESLLVLAADEGAHQTDAVITDDLRPLTNGGTTLPAFPVNFHALGEHAVSHGGQAFFAGHEPDGLCVAAFVWDEMGRDHAATRQAFVDTTDLFGPQEFFRVTKSLERTGSQLTCSEMLAYLRWSAWDVKVLQILLPHLRERLPAASPHEVIEWGEALERVWSLYYHLDADEGDAAFAIGATLARVSHWSGAIPFFERSRTFWGDDGNTLYNIAVCHARLGDRQKALACVDGVLTSTPGHAQALHLRRELASTVR